MEAKQLVPQQGRRHSPKPYLAALRYVRDAGGKATKAEFYRVHGPQSTGLWNVLFYAELIRVVVSGKVFITKAGLSRICIKIKGRTLGA